MILSPSSSSSVTAEAVTGGGVGALGTVSVGALAGLGWGDGGGPSSSPSCVKEWMGVQRRQARYVNQHNVIQCLVSLASFTNSSLETAQLHKMYPSSPSALSSSFTLFLKYLFVNPFAFNQKCGTK